MKQEERIRQTKHAFRLALLNTLPEKPLHKISVRDLTEKTGLNRSTFYLHYHDVYDLKDDLVQPILNGLVDRFRRHSVAEQKKSIVPLLRDIFDYADRNREVLITLSQTELYQKLVDEVNSEVRAIFFPVWAAVLPGANREKFELYFHFVTSGVLAAISYWLRSGSETLDEIVESTEQLIRFGEESLY